MLDLTRAGSKEASRSYESMSDLSDWGNTCRRLLSIWQKLDRHDREAAISYLNATKEVMDSQWTALKESSA